MTTIEKKDVIPTNGQMPIFGQFVAVWYNESTESIWSGTFMWVGPYIVRYNSNTDSFDEQLKPEYLAGMPGVRFITVEDF